MLPVEDFRIALPRVNSVYQRSLLFRKQNKCHCDTSQCDTSQFDDE